MGFPQIYVNLPWGYPRLSQSFPEKQLLSFQPSFISFKRSGVLLSPQRSAAGGISGGVTPTVGVTIPEMFNFLKISSEKMAIEWCLMMFNDILWCIYDHIMIILWYIMIYYDHTMIYYDIWSGWWLSPTPLKNMSQLGLFFPIFPNIWKSKKCSKPPTISWYLMIFI